MISRRKGDGAFSAVRRSSDKVLVVTSKKSSDFKVARSKEECVQSGPRSSDFVVKDAADKNKERHEEAERPLSLGAAAILELLRGESRR